MLKSFGAADPPLFHAPNPALAFAARVVRKLGMNTWARRLGSLSIRPMSREEQGEYGQRLCEYVSSIDIGPGAQPLDELGISTVGDPGHLFEWKGHRYCMSTLYYFMRYAYVSRFVDFSRVTAIAELSSGSGKQAEVLARLHPKLTLLLFDVPPQLYVAHQYLRAVFPERVVAFDPSAHLDSKWSPAAGKIHILGNWQMSLLNRLQVDLFWTAASLGEMEPNVVSHYLQIVDSAAKHAYLMQKMDGKELASRAGKPGVLSQVTYEHYRAGLSSFRNVDRSAALLPTGKLVGLGYEDSLWVRSVTAA